MYLLLWLLPGSAIAQEADDAARAEQTRLQDEIQRFAEREAWDGVERTYTALLALEARGLAVTYAEHVLAAQAAQARGDVGALRERLARAVDSWDTPFARDWLGTLNAGYGQVTVEVAPRFKEILVLRPAEPPFAVDARFAIEFAQDNLEERRAFDGWLPIGEYTLGAERFTVTPDTPTTLRFDTGGGPAGGDSPLSARLRLGGGFGAAGAPGAAQIQPGGFSGFSPQLALGGALALTGPLRVGAEVGWQATFAGEDSGTVNFGYGWVFAAAEVSDLRVEFGPMFGLGQARGVGVDEQTRRSYCAENDCPATTPDADLILTGAVRGAGIGAGGNYAIARTGPLRWRAGLHLGALNDASRWYSWAQVGVTAQFGGGS